MKAINSQAELSLKNVKSEKKRLLEVSFRISVSVLCVLMISIF